MDFVPLAHEYLMPGHRVKGNPLSGKPPLPAFPLTLSLVRALLGRTALLDPPARSLMFGAWPLLETKSEDAAADPLTRAG